MTEDACWWVIGTPGTAYSVHPDGSFRRDGEGRPVDWVATEIEGIMEMITSTVQIMNKRAMRLEDEPGEEYQPLNLCVDDPSRLPVTEIVELDKLASRGRAAYIEIYVVA